MLRIINSGGEKSCMFWEVSSHIVFQSWILFLKHTVLLDHTGNKATQVRIE